MTIEVSIRKFQIQKLQKQIQNSSKISEWKYFENKLSFGGLGLKNHKADSQMESALYVDNEPVGLVFFYLRSNQFVTFAVNVDDSYIFVVFQ